MTHCKAHVGILNSDLNACKILLARLTSDACMHTFLTIGINSTTTLAATLRPYTAAARIQLHKQFRHSKIHVCHSCGRVTTHTDFELCGHKTSASASRPWCSSVCVVIGLLLLYMSSNTYTTQVTITRTRCRLHSVVAMRRSVHRRKIDTGTLCAVRTGFWGCGQA